MNARRPVMAALVAASSLFALAAPAGASTTTTTWSHKTLTCQGGRHATVTYKWQGGVVVDSWATNNCRHQYLNLVWCEVGGDSPKCGQADVWPATKAHVGGGNAENGVALELGPQCDGPAPMEICEA